jgi:inorganic pyrophosphatase
MNIKTLDSIKSDLVRVIIETPKGSQNKFVFDPDLKLFRLKKTLPMGTVFPFDFGFIPNTKGEDGDPLDVLVIMDEPAYPGCLVECRMLGVLKANQKKKTKEKKRNDRLVAVADTSILYKDVHDLKELNKNIITEICDFFIYYNKREDKKFEPLEWENAESAMKLIRKSIEAN